MDKFLKKYSPSVSLSAVLSFDVTRFSNEFANFGEIAKIFSFFVDIKLYIHTMYYVILIISYYITISHI